MSTWISIILLGQPDNTKLALLLEVGLGLVLVLLVAAAERYLGDEAAKGLPAARKSDDDCCLTPVVVVMTDVVGHLCCA